MPNTSIQADGGAMPASSPDAAEERDVLDAVMDADILLSKCGWLNQLVYLAGESLAKSDRKTANAITTGCDVIDDMMKDVSNLLDEISERARSSKTGRASA